MNSHIDNFLSQTFKEESIGIHCTVFPSSRSQSILPKLYSTLLWEKWRKSFPVLVLLLADYQIVSSQFQQASSLQKLLLLDLNEMPVLHSPSPILSAVKKLHVRFCAKQRVPIFNICFGIQLSCPLHHHKINISLPLFYWSYFI